MRVRGVELFQSLPIVSSLFVREWGESTVEEEGEPMLRPSMASSSTASSTHKLTD
jgi:hypothetical protein